MITDTAARSFLFALKFRSLSRLVPRSFLASFSASPLIHSLSIASLALSRTFASTVSREEIRSFASEDTVPQYSVTNKEGQAMRTYKE